MEFDIEDFRKIADKIEGGSWDYTELHEYIYDLDQTYYNGDHSFCRQEGKYKDIWKAYFDLTRKITKERKEFKFVYSYYVSKEDGHYEGFEICYRDIVSDEECYQFLVTDDKKYQEKEQCEEIIRRWYEEGIA